MGAEEGSTELMHTSVTEGFTGDLEVCVVEDDPAAEAVVVGFLKHFYSDRIRAVFTAGSRESFDELIQTEERRLWLTDVCFGSYQTGEKLPFQEMLAYLQRQEGSTGWVIMSGVGVDEYVTALGDPGDDMLISALGKPYDMNDFTRVLGPIFDHLGGIPSLDDDDIPAEDIDLPENVRFAALIGSFRFFPDLIKQLPKDPSQVVSENAAYDLSGKIAQELKYLHRLLEQGLNIQFVDRWNRSFSHDENSRDDCLFGILEEVEGARFVLEVCLHDVRNILNRGGNENCPSEVKGEVMELLAVARDSFEDYYATCEPQYWVSQSLQAAIASNDHNFPQRTVELQDEDVMINCPAGALRSILRTFYSNFAKVRRVTGQDDAVLNLEIRQNGDEVVFQVSDNLKAFDQDQLKQLFEEGIRSEKGAFGMGTGLARTAEIIQAAGGRITSYHHRQRDHEMGMWVQKSPGGEPQERVPREIPMAPAGTTKFFEFRLPILSYK